MLTCNDCIHCDVCVRQKIYGEYSITECKGHFLGKEDVQEVKHGKWIKPTPCSQEYCNQCGLTPKMVFGVLPNYCPHCGAKMDKRSADNGKVY